MWARGRYELQLTDAEFYALTPQQFRRLMRRHREARTHAEMVSAHTTAAVINSGFAKPETPANALDFMPSHSSCSSGESDAEENDEAAELRSSYELKAMRLATQMKAGSGPMLDRLRNGEKL